MPIDYKRTREDVIKLVSDRYDLVMSDPIHSDSEALTLALVLEWLEEKMDAD